MPRHSPGPPSLLAATEHRRRNLISLTPLIDVVFILLVFFMLASSFMDWRSVRLTPPAMTGGGTDLAGTMLIDVRADDLRLSGQVLALGDIVRRMGDIVRRKPGQVVIVRPAPGVSLQRTINVLDRLGAAGVTHLSLNRAGRRP